MSNDINKIALKDLVGNRKLSGVDRETEEVKRRWSEQYEGADVIRFVLDGVTYMAIEDPDDGYRSSMKKIITSDMPIKNSFPEIEVFAKMRDDDKYDKYDKHDVLELFDAKNNKLILSVGTGNYEDYYPYWIAEFIPENRYINE